MTNFDFNGIFLDAEAITEPGQTAAQEKKASGSSVDNGPVQRRTRGGWSLGIFGYQSEAIKGTICSMSYPISYHPCP